MDIQVLQRAYDREKERRRQAENLLEEKSRELYLSYENLDKSHKELEQTHTDLKKKQQELVQLINAYASVTDDLQLAARLQKDLLPAALITDQFAASGHYLPARYVGGDAYDYFMLSEDVLAFYIIDVEGHGTASAMTSFAIHSQLNPKYDGICSSNLQKFSDHSGAVCATVRQLNSSFYNPESTNKYFTMIYGLLDLATGVVTWCQAGHPALILCSQDGVREVGDGGFPVGTLENAEFTASSVTMLPGDRFAVYSDGIVECFSESERAFGVTRLIDMIEQSRGESQSDSLHQIQNTVAQWNGGNEFSDDVTLLLVDYLGKS